MWSKNETFLQIDVICLEKSFDRCKFDQLNFGVIFLKNHELIVINPKMVILSG